MSIAGPSTLRSGAIPVRNSISARILHWSGLLLVTAVWISAGLFGLYILAFYAAAFYEGDLQRWNNILPGLYEERAVASNAGMGIHLAMGGMILVLGNIQLIESLRNRWPRFHRWTGRLYVTASLLAAGGGLAFILIKGTIGGTVMNIGFGLYGLLMLIAAVETWRHAAAGRMEQHRAWALRLYALAIGSWLYRMDYGFWIPLTGKLWHKPDFTGPFDQLMTFFFYIPNLVIAEVFIRSKRALTNPFVHIFSAIVLLFLVFMLSYGTYYFMKIYWGPAIVQWFTGLVG